MRDSSKLTGFHASLRATALGAVVLSIGFAFGCGGGNPTGNGSAAAKQAAAPSLAAVSPSSAPAGGGTTVAVTGTSLAQGDGISFGSTPAPNVVFIPASSTDAASLVAVSPAG
ncbi:MAG: IPT/TIG domain-containing protein, partial [Terriglobales bacterium]